MFKHERNKKNHAKALVDMRNRVGPTPSCLAIGDVYPIQDFKGIRVPKFSTTPKGTFSC